jgi:phage terminase small subunit
MGGKGSGSLPDNPNWGGGRSKRSAVSVAGSGMPEMPDNLPPLVQDEWHRLVEVTSGVTFSQDSSVLADLAWATVLMRKCELELRDNWLDPQLHKQWLDLGRRKLALQLQLGLTPRSRQVLVVPDNDQEEVDPLEALRNS